MQLSIVYVVSLLAVAKRGWQQGCRQECLYRSTVYVNWCFHTGAVYLAITTSIMLAVPKGTWDRINAMLVEARFV